MRHNGWLHGFQASRMTVQQMSAENTKKQGIYPIEDTEEFL
jgi:hypothetical protein